MPRPVSACLLPALLLSCLTLAGCSSSPQSSEVETALREGQNFELISFNPDHWRQEEPAEVPEMHGWAILGSTDQLSNADRERLVASLHKSLGPKLESPPGCFHPRHGLRVEHEGVVYEFVICFECFQVEWYKDGVAQEDLSIGTGPRPLANKILEDAGVPLPAQGH